MLVLAILAAVAFNVTSGFHDAAEICAPGVVTGAIRPAGALAFFAVMVFIGPFLAGTAVADTIGGFVNLSGEDPVTALGIVAAGIAGAAVWNVVTWRFAIPSSSTHALVGGLVGVTVVAAGPGDVIWGLRGTRRRATGGRDQDRGRAGSLAGRGHRGGLPRVPHRGAWRCAARRGARTVPCGASWWAARACWPSPTAATRPRRAWASSPLALVLGGRLVVIRDPAVGRS